MRIDNRPITSKQSAFADEWIANGNDAKAAYKLVYAVNPKVTDNSLYVQSSRLLANSKVALRIEQKTKALAKRKDRGLDAHSNAAWAIIDDLKAPHASRVAALQLSARLHGLLIDRKEIHTTTDEVDTAIAKGLADGSITLDELRNFRDSEPIIDVTPTEALPAPHTEE